MLVDREVSAATATVVPKEEDVTTIVGLVLATTLPTLAYKTVRRKRPGKGLKVKVTTVAEQLMAPLYRELKFSTNVAPETRGLLVLVIAPEVPHKMGAISESRMIGSKSNIL